MMAIYESARRHQVIKLPMEEKEYPLDLMIAEGKLPLEVQGRYDIRGFLDRSNIDESRYRQLRDNGVQHHQAMRTIHEEWWPPSRQQRGIRTAPVSGQRAISPLLLSLVFISCFLMPSSPGFSTQLAKYEFDELCQPEGAVHQSYILYPASARQTRFYLHFDC